MLLRWLLYYHVYKNIPVKQPSLTGNEEEYSAYLLNKISEPRTTAYEQHTNKKFATSVRKRSDPLFLQVWSPYGAKLTKYDNKSLIICEELPIRDCHSASMAEQSSVSEVRGHLYNIPVRHCDVPLSRGAPINKLHNKIVDSMTDRYVFKTTRIYQKIGI